MKKFLVILLPLILFASVVGCASNTKPETANNQSQTSQQTQTFKVGERVKLGNYYLTVNGFEDYVEENEYMQPDEGNKFLAVDVTIENGGTESASYNALDFEIQDSESYTYDTSMATKAPDLGSGDLQEGRKIRGWVTFEVPTTATGLELIYQPSLWDTGQVIVKLTD